MEWLKKGEIPTGSSMSVKTIDDKQDTAAVAVQSLSPVWLSESPWTVAWQASLSSTIPQSLLRFMSFELVMLSFYLILCCPLFLLPSIFPIIEVFSNELALHIRWPKYWSFGFRNSPSNDYLRSISLWLVSSPWSPRDSEESSPAQQFESTNSSALSLFYSPTLM